MPAAAVIPAPLAYIKVVAVETFLVERMRSTRAARTIYLMCVARSGRIAAHHPSRAFTCVRAGCAFTIF